MTVLSILILVASVTTLLFLLTKAWPVKGEIGLFSKDTFVLDKPIITVATYNIHRARGIDGKKDIFRIANMVQNVDLIGLQEVEGSAIYRLSNQATLMGKYLKSNFHFSATRKLCFFPHRGNAILSRFPIGSWESVRLVPSKGRAHRNLTVYQVNFKDRTTYILNTHLSKPSESEEPFKAVLQKFAQYERAILLGDFNTPVDSKVIQKWMPDDAIDALEALGYDAERVDMIFTKGMKIKEAWSRPVGPSDHPLYAVRLIL